MRAFAVVVDSLNQETERRMVANYSPKSPKIKLSLQCKLKVRFGSPYPKIVKMFGGSEKVFPNS